MIRTWIMLFVCLAGFPLEGNADEWTAWLYASGVLLQVDEHGNELQRVVLPMAEDHCGAEIGISHNGNFFAYVSHSDLLKTAQLRVYDLQEKRLRIQYDLPYDRSTMWTRILQDSRNFSLDDTAFALGYWGGEPDGWHILVFDLKSGTVAHTLTRNASRLHYLYEGDIQPLIYHFAADTITFAVVNRVTVPGAGDPFPWSVDWHLSTNTFSENCLYTRVENGTFEPTGEVIEPAIHRGFFENLDPDLQTGEQYILEFYDPVTRLRRVFYQGLEATNDPTFVQNGERIVTWGGIDEAHPRHLSIIERNGRLLNQLEVLGLPHVKGTNDGFVYTLFDNTAEYVSKLYYMNTREKPFGQPSAVFAGNPGEEWHVIWAKSKNELPQPHFLPWNDLMTYNPDCPPFRG